MNQTGFSFLLNRLRFTGRLPFEVSDGVVFDKATSRQALEIINVIEEGHLKPFGDLWYYSAEPRPDGDNGPAYAYKHCAKDKIEFWVLNFDSPSRIQRMDLPFRLIEPEIETGALLYKGGRNFNPPTAFHFFQSNIHPAYGDLCEESLREVRILEQLIRNSKRDNANHAKQSILGILENFNASRAYIRLGHMALLSHFTIIEGLLTHAPGPDAGDSLNHQISTKIPLLFARMERPVQHQQIFGEIEIRKLWKKLYAVRSVFAHGDNADFRGKFAELKSFDLVERYVYSSMKGLLRLALREPQLVYDLRSC